MLSKLLPAALHFPGMTNRPAESKPEIYLAPASSFRSGVVLKTIALKNERERMIKHKAELERQLAGMDDKIAAIDERIRLNDVEKFRVIRKHS